MLKTTSSVFNRLEKIASPSAMKVRWQPRQLPDESILPLDALEDVKANSGHNVHADCDVGRVGQLDTVLREGSSHRSHAEWDNVHGAT